MSPKILWQNTPKIIVLLLCLQRGFYDANFGDSLGVLQRGFIIVASPEMSIPPIEVSAPWPLEKRPSLWIFEGY